MLRSSFDDIKPEGYTGEKENLFGGVEPAEIYESIKTGRIYQGRVIGVEKDEISGQKALVINHQGLKGYIIKEDIGVKPKNLAALVGSTVVYKIKHYSRKTGRLYLDRKSVIEEMSQKTWEHLEPAEAVLKPIQEEIKETEKALDEARTSGDKALISQLKSKRNSLYEELRKKGVQMPCSVRFVLDYGAYVDIGGIMALLPQTEVTHSFVDDVREYIQPGQSFDVKVIWVDRENGIVKVSLRAVLPDPWEDVESRYKKKGIYVGRVKFITPAGPKVELEPGIIVSTPFPVLPISEVKVGDEVTVVINKINKEQKRLIGKITKNLSRI